jgi:hypothetical protein
VLSFEGKMSEPNGSDGIREEYFQNKMAAGTMKVAESRFTPKEWSGEEASGSSEHNSGDNI